MYHVVKILDAEMTRLSDPIATTDSIVEARTIAQQPSYYGHAIVDVDYGTIDWGFGFGVEPPEEK